MSCYMTPSVTVVQKDDLPAIRVQFKDANTDVPVDISHPDWIAKARFRERGSDTTLFEATLTKIDGGRDGWALMEWPTDGLDDLDVGRYELQPFIEIDGAVQTTTNTVAVRVIEKFPVAS